MPGFTAFLPFKFILSTLINGSVGLDLSKYEFNSDFLSTRTC